MLKHVTKKPLSSGQLDQIQPGSFISSYDIPMKAILGRERDKAGAKLFWPYNYGNTAIIQGSGNRKRHKNYFLTYIC